MHDLVIRNGSIVERPGNAAYTSNVSVDDESISAVGVIFLMFALIND